MLTSAMTIKKSLIITHVYVTTAFFFDIIVFRYSKWLRVSLLDGFLDRWQCCEIIIKKLEDD